MGKEPTDNSEQLIGAAVGEEAAHGVSTWEGRHAFPTVLMGLDKDARKGHTEVELDMTALI